MKRQRKHCLIVLLFLSVVNLVWMCGQADDGIMAGDPGITGIKGPHWQQLDLTTKPSPRNRVQSAYDPDTDKLILFGGLEYNPPYDNVYLNDTWEFVNNEWQKIEPPVSPPPRMRGGMCYCPAWQKFILFGGSYSSTHLNDTWSYDHVNGWIQLEPIHQPEARSYFGMTFDESLGKVLLYGGFPFEAHQFWAFNGIDWEQLDSGLVGFRVSTKMVYDSNRQRTVLYGGFVNLYDLFNDTWEYDGQQWQKRSLPHNPTKRYSFNMCYYPVQKKCVLFGGGTVAGGDFNDTWVYDGTDWQKLSLRTSPPARIFMSLDSCGDQVIMFGGTMYSTTDMDDTWAYSVGIKIPPPTPVKTPPPPEAVMTSFTGSSAD